MRVSKELEKFRKSYQPLKKSADALVLDYTKHCTNREHHKQMLLESAKEVGRAVQAAKDKGAGGKTVRDFASDGDVAAAMKTAQTALGALDKEETRLNKLLKDANGAVSDLTKLHKTVSEEVDARKKKRDRKIASVDSKSLPDMEKLAGEIRGSAQKLRDDLLGMEQIQKWSQAEEKRNFDKWVQEEIGKTKDSRKARDQDETDGRAFDVRIVNRQLGELKQLVTQARDRCAEAEKLFKNNAPVDADGCIREAHAALEGLRKIRAPYERALKKMNKYQLQGMKDSKDGKFVLDAVEKMGTAIEGTSKLIKKTSRATM
jgi:hypothetical protein